ncbi:glycosyltransferase family 2 protein [Exercitatus varius]|uniref:glycosyltransferase family 2 protein n=1 Tax=Exercitatus varius TaxID=67857 RepID=UPI00294AA262|nr:glycosyltransferase family 2 protein [Exercitatus varius]MDG2952827.1 glycosyltransferase family 2 protein [Exercitatus varius]
MTPIISIIIPFYKTPHILLRKAINSLLKQSFQDFELLIINDGNTDEYNYLIDEYIIRDKRIKFIYQENSGVSAARNLGIRSATGKYIIFHDADDFVENNYLYSLYYEIQRSDLVICGVAAQRYPSIDSYVDIREFLSTPSQYNYVQYTNFSVNKIFKRDILIENNIFFHEDLKLGEDALFISEYISKCKLIRCISQNLYYYIPYQSSATRKYDSKYWEYEKRVIESQLSLFSTYPLNKNEEDFQLHWLYLKLRGTLFYYLWWEKDHSLRDHILKDIANSKYFKLVLAEKDSLCHSRIDRLVIHLWKKLGVNGIKFSYYLKIIKDRFNK